MSDAKRLLDNRVGHLEFCSLNKILCLSRFYLLNLYLCFIYLFMTCIGTLNLYVPDTIFHVHHLTD